MDAAKKAFSDNYVEYAITGNNSYKVAYEAAQKSIETTLSNLENSAPQKVEMLKTHNTSRTFLGRTTTTGPLPIPSMTNQYLLLGGLGLLGIGLWMFSQ
jgi:hypothetical protein